MYCFHDGEEFGPAALVKIGNETGWRSEDLEGKRLARPRSRVLVH